MSSSFTPRPAVSASIQDLLVEAGVPLESLATACAGCPEDGDDLEEYPAGFDVDMDSDLLGTMSGYGRQILISTGKSDWEREVTDIKGSLAEHIKICEEQQTKVGEPAIVDAGEDSGECKSKRIPGVYPAQSSSTALSSVVPSLEKLSLSNSSTEHLQQPPSTRLSILNASFLSSSAAHHHKSVLIFPDFISVHDIEETRTGAQDLIDEYLGKTERGKGLGAGATKSWPLPYHAVVLICSHKRRDKRCHQAAPLLISAFHHHLEHHNLEIDERADDITDDGPAIEDYDEATRAQRLEEALQGVQKNGSRVAVLKISHIGGHRYAGNVVIYLPNGTSIWYGRVTPRDVGAIVQTTIIGGKVIPELLRGAMGVTGKTSKEGVLAW